MRPQGIAEEHVKLRASPFSLADQAKDWLYFLPLRSITNWNDLKKKFLEKYFPASRATTIWKEISGIHQFVGESFFEYWGRFKQLVESYPHHQIPDHLLIQYFYEVQIRYDDPPRSNEVSMAAFDDRLNKLTSFVEKIAIEKHQQGDFSENNKGDMTLSPTPIPPDGRITRIRAMVPNPKTFRDPNTDRLCHLLHLIPNQQNASAIVLLSGKGLQSNVDKNDTKRGHAQKRKPKKEIEIAQEQDDKPKEDHPKVLVTRPSFAERFTKSKKEEEEKDIFETFRKVKENIPLLDSIKQIPRYAKFLKELCTNKDKLM
ncbi:UNVERIFIED_CONTAM: hypothetical protein Slati_4534000 [Sesamum latifolium]|uniref:Retrotransposon gag domain-containing protein n=1 Tax=Sesamum latifolium TaxID=2727402 RepID=A0AAW2SH80_9LAMI